MKSKLLFIRRKTLFILIFTILGFILLQIPVNTLAGSKVKFTLFDLFAPISGAFLGTPLGIISVLAMQAGNLGLGGFSGVNTSSPLTLIATLRFLPLVVGVWFFALRSTSRSQGKLFTGQISDMILLIPLLSIIAFNLHPVGRSVWFYSLFWVIPFLVWPFRERFLVARALGSTMSAHAVGGAVWIWAFNLPANVWITLIPVVVLERSIFTLGISASYILVNNILGYLSAKKLIPKAITFDQKYYFLHR